MYGSVGGTAERLAGRCCGLLGAEGVGGGAPLVAVPAEAVEVETLPELDLLVVVVCSQAGGSPPPNAAWLIRWLRETAEDFRAGALLFQRTRFAVFGVGDRAYGDDFNGCAKEVHALLERLGGRPASRLGLGDTSSATPVEAQLDSWARGLARRLKAGPRREPAAAEGGLAPGFPAGAPAGAAGGGLLDIEDLDNEVVGLDDGSADHNDGPQEMVTPVVRESLTKQGYKIVGTHSGVKICRWTKAMLRGRGGCYKHSFYGIASHRCMEATPSLACANKCVFCWRHHTNPVGKEWKWKMEGPLEIVEGAVSEHRRMVKQMRGVPGVKPERLEEGMAVRHCALSLVGEPIMYPKINELCDELHRRGISTFLVTNAQFPEKIIDLVPVTQLYVSVDAATKEQLKEIDRPLFGDFWERFLSSLTSLREKRQRTVYRLTLVKGWNAEEVKEYAELLDLGRPDFVEIKGVTFCGDHGTSSLTMKSVPFHEEVKAFGEAICEARGGEYGLACEHAHSCCILLARTDRFFRDGRWHTWIDYEKFQDLLASGEPFSSDEYLLPTPEWAVWGAEEAGFDPEETRFRKKRNHPGKKCATEPVAAACT